MIRLYVVQISSKRRNADVQSSLMVSNKLSRDDCCNSG
jgi:hypothetical protein